MPDRNSRHVLLGMLLKALYVTVAFITTLGEGVRTLFFEVPKNIVISVYSQKRYTAISSKKKAAHSKLPLSMRLQNYVYVSKKNIIRTLFGWNKKVKKTYRKSYPAFVKKTFHGVHESKQFFENTGNRFWISFKKIFVKSQNKRSTISVEKKEYTIRKLTKNNGIALLGWFVGGMALVAVIFGLWDFLLKDLPSPHNIGKTNYDLSTRILDRNGVELYQIFKDQNRVPVSIDTLPAYVPQAFIAIEDKNFYKHQGVSFVGGVLRALKENLTTGSIQGGSTITQQLVKFSLLSSKKTVKRKLQEIILAMWTERIYSKKQILEMYLNHVSFGGSVYGIQQAAKTYYGKDAKDLTINEAAVLAALPQAPSRFSPFVNPDAAENRRKEILSKMLESGYITQADYATAVDHHPDFLTNTVKIVAPHFVFYVRDLLEQEYGADMVERGGLVVTTTVDSRLQEQAEDIVREELKKVEYLHITNGALLVTKPQSGEILAMVGSKDYFATGSGTFNVTTALRQPGSMLKPLVYSLALERGYTAAKLIDDSPITYKLWNGDTYSPVNYDSRFHGKVSMRYALANSYNIPAVKTLDDIGIDSYIDFATKIGITTWSDRSRYGLSLALGGGEVKMVDVAGAFSVIANMGTSTATTPIISVHDMSGKELYFPRPARAQAMNPSNAYIMADIMSDNVARQRAFGTRHNLAIPGYTIAAKTGTTNDKRDNWTVGFNPDVLTVVWVGNNDYSPMNKYLASGITGAAPIWNRVMQAALKDYNIGNDWYQRPSDIVDKTCFAGRKELFIRGTEVGAVCFAPTPTPSPSPAP